MGIPSRELKRQLLVAAVIDGGQTVKVVVDPGRLTDHNGFPASVVEAFPDGIPLNLDPRWPLKLDHDENFLSADLAFNGNVQRCFIPWGAIATFAIGLGGVNWEYDDSPVAVREKDTTVAYDDAGNTVIDMAARRKK